MYYNNVSVYSINVKIIFNISGMAWLTRLTWLLGGKDIEAKIVIVGLPNAGKSTLMRQLKPHEISMTHLSPTLPGICRPAEKFTFKALTFIAFDLIDLRGFGNPWEDFYKGCDGIIFMLDSTDRLNMPVVQSQLQKLLEHPYVKGTDVPLMLLANKTDQGADSIPSLQLTDMLSLQQCSIKRPWATHGTAVLTGEGLNEALDWLAHQLRRTSKSVARRASIR